MPFLYNGVHWDHLVLSIYDVLSIKKVYPFSFHCVKTVFFYLQIMFFSESFSYFWMKNQQKTSKLNKKCWKRPKKLFWPVFMCIKHTKTGGNTQHPPLFPWLYLRMIPFLYFTSAGWRQVHSMKQFYNLFWRELLLLAPN